MKKILLSLTAITAAAGLNAQILTANAAADFQTWSIADVDGDGWNWGIYDLTGVGSAIDGQGECAISFSWGDPGDAAQGAYTPDNLLISPAMDMTSVTGTVTLSWGAGSIEDAGSSFAAEYYSVYVVSDPTQVATATPVFSETLADGGQMYSHSVDISSFAGQAAVYVIFRHYNCTDMYTLVIDDVDVSASGGSASIEESTIEANAYPNPASTVLNVVSSANATTVSIITMDGKVVATENVNGTVAAINVADLIAGVYFYEVVGEDGAVVRNTFVKK